MANDKPSAALPVIIAGAGPCGLVAAITLQQEGVPFVLLERAKRERLCSNVGSGFDLAPTAMNILKKRLNIKTIEESNGFKTYGGMYMCDMDGKVVRDCSMSEMMNSTGRGDEYSGLFVSANRATMQECFLSHLFEKARVKNKNFDESEILKCGVEVVGYEDTKDQVTVQLNDGTKVVGSVLLACDGIHSAVRRCLMESLPSKPKDELHSCNTICWWGKMEMKPGGALAKALDTTQTQKQEGAPFIWALGDPKRPGGFMGAPNADTFMWACFMKSKDVPAKFSDDLTRRGGTKLDEDSKITLEKMFQDRSEIFRLAIYETPPSGITKVGLYDRENLDLPYSQGRVALLGDAAHPQSPMMGQGVNQAITDAYVCSMRLSRESSVTTALSNYDSETRRKGVNGVIRQARSYSDLTVSNSWFVCALFKFFVRWTPISWLWADMLAGDTPNSDFVSQLDNDLGVHGQ